MAAIKNNLEKKNNDKTWVFPLLIQVITTVNIFTPHLK